MKRDVVVKEKASLQLTEAFLWYEAQQPNLGVAFLGRMGKYSGIYFSSR